MCVCMWRTKTDVSDFVYFFYRLFLNHIIHHVTYATYHEPVTSRGVLRLFLNRMLHHVTYATNHESATSRGVRHPPKPINSIHHSVTSFSRRQHSSAVGPHHSSPLCLALNFYHLRQLTGFQNYIFLTFTNIYGFWKLHFSIFWVYTQNFWARAPKRSQAWSQELRSLRPLYHSPQGIKNTLKIQNFNFSSFRPLISMPSSGGTKGLNYRVQSSWVTSPVPLLLTALEPRNICCSGTWSSNQTGCGAILVFSSFFNQIFHQKKSEISVVILSPTWR